ncbi:hypothetical protein L2E82_21194 [Cichorium intybus]|uniref:Uncharacterized protein n=1 Tax=Cichorium intybus TaxID=13427 RepID=A0ACB9DUZ7_CICIN|nr:hypothetical protein L2E82_21194 [Cichorium intybus]
MTRRLIKSSATEYMKLWNQGFKAEKMTYTHRSICQFISSKIFLCRSNQMGGIDEAALDRLSLVTEMTKHIRVRASGAKTVLAIVFGIGLCHL